MPTPLQPAIFDVDGVLVDSPHEKAWREAAVEHLGVPDLEAHAAAYAQRKQAMVVRLIEAGDFTACPDALRFILAVKDARTRDSSSAGSGWTASPRRTGSPPVGQ